MTNKIEEWSKKWKLPLGARAELDKILLEKEDFKILISQLHKAIDNVFAEVEEELKSTK